jgi:hypothetical protein
MSDIPLTVIAADTAQVKTTKVIEIKKKAGAELRRVTGIFF